MTNSTYILKLELGEAVDTQFPTATNLSFGASYTKSQSIVGFLTSTPPKLVNSHDNGGKIPPISVDIMLVFPLAFAVMIIGVMFAGADESQT